MNPRDYLELAASRSNGRIAQPYDEQIVMANTLFESMKIPNVVQVSQGPTGMGKTIVELSVGHSLTDIDKRVLIAAPTHNHIRDNLLQEAKLIFDEIPPVMYGVSHQRYAIARNSCPRGLESCRAPGSKECEPYQDECIIEDNYFKCKSTNIVFTTHAYIVSKPSFVDGFDVLFVDESHGLPNVIRGSSKKSLSPQTLQELLDREKKNPEVFSALQLAKAEFDKVLPFTDRGVAPPPVIAQQALEALKRAAQKTPEGSELSQWTFMDQPKFSPGGSLTASRYHKKHNWAETLSVGLISATVEDPRAHAKDCGFEGLVLRPKIQIDTPFFRERFEKRPIFGLIDGPRLAKGDMDNYDHFRTEANEIILKLVRLVEEVTLILCQNKTDSQSIQEAIGSVPDLQDRLSILPDDEDALSDVDSCEEFIKNEINEGRRIIIATASSKLWEGANVPELRYLIIDALPYRRPEPEEVGGRGAKAAQSWKNMKRFMLNRVQQGIGRLVRSDGEWGIAVIIDERMYTNRLQFFKVLPRYITSDQIFRWVTKDNIETKIAAMARKLRSGGNARTSKSLKDYQ